VTQIGMDVFWQFFCEQVVINYQTSSESKHLNLRAGRTSHLDVFPVSQPECQGIEGLFQYTVY